MLQYQSTSVLQYVTIGTSRTADIPVLNFVLSLIEGFDYFSFIRPSATVTGYRVRLPRTVAETSDPKEGHRLLSDGPILQSLLTRRALISCVRVSYDYD